MSIFKRLEHLSVPSLSFAGLGDAEVFFQDGLEEFSYDCSSCPDPCCKDHLGINLPLKDVAVILDNGLDDKIIGSFDTAINIINFNSDPGKNAPPKLPGLLHVDHRCSFFNKQAKCDIHPFRPHVCRTFPFIFQCEQNNNQTIYKISVSTTCPFHPSSNKFHKADKISPYLLKNIQAAISEQQECHRTLSLLVNLREQLANIGFAKYLA